MEDFGGVFAGDLWGIRQLRLDQSWSFSWSNRNVMKRDVLESRTTDNSIEATVLSKREAFEACCERILKPPKEHKPVS